MAKVELVNRKINLKKHRETKGDGKIFLKD